MSTIRHVESGARVHSTPTWVNFYGPAHREDGTPLPVGTAVLALDPDGVACGATMVTTEGYYGLLPCYGDDSTTPEDEGAQAGDIIQLVVDGVVLGEGTWTAHGERQLVALGGLGPSASTLYMPLIVRAVGQQ